MSNSSFSYQYSLANPRHRLGGIILNLVFQGITFNIGWFIWSLVVWGQGQTPGHQILRMRVYSIDTGKPATWGHMAIRQFLIPMTYFSGFWLAVLISGGIQNFQNSGQTNGSGVYALIFGWLATGGIWITDALWIFRGQKRQRLADVWARTQVFNEAN